MGCIRRLFQLILFGALIVILAILFLPHLLAQAGNSLLSSNNNAPSLSGLVQFVPANFIDKSNKLQVSLSGLNAKAKYELTLDPDSCGNAGYVDVGTITSDGNGNVTTTFSLNSLDTTRNWYVDIHNGADANGTPVACGQLNTNTNSAAADATNTLLQTSPTPINPGPVTIGSTGGGDRGPVTTNSPNRFPNTGVAPGSNNGYNNTAFPRKF